VAAGRGEKEGEGAVEGVGEFRVEGEGELRAEEKREELRGGCAVEGKEAA
jgi:hypothetical protein